MQRNFAVIPKTIDYERMSENMASVDDSCEIDAEGMSIMSRWRSLGFSARLRPQPRAKALCFGRWDENFVTGWDPTSDE